MKKTITSFIALIIVFSFSACNLMEKNPINTSNPDSSTSTISSAGRDGNTTKDRRGDSTEKSSITDVYSMIKDFVPKDFLNNAISGNFNVNDITGYINVQGRTETKTIDASNVNSVILKADIGNVEVSLSNDNNIYVEISYGLIGSKDTTFSEEDLDNVSWQAENVNGTVNIGHSNNKSDAASIIAANYKISVPANINVIDIDSDIANVVIKDISAQLNISVGTGNVEAHNVGLKYDSFVDVSTGSIRLNISRLEDIKSISSRCSAGEIALNITEANLGTLESIDIENKVGSIDFKMVTPFDNIRLKNTFGDITSNVDYK